MATSSTSLPSVNERTISKIIRGSSDAGFETDSSIASRSPFSSYKRSPEGGRHADLISFEFEEVKKGPPHLGAVFPADNVLRPKVQYLRDGEAPPNCGPSGNHFSPEHVIPLRLRIKASSSIKAKKPPMQATFFEAGATGVNPALTIAAVAERIAERLVKTL